MVPSTNAPSIARPGFFAKGNVLTQADATAVFVPADAVTYIAGLSKVFVVNGTTVNERLIRAGDRHGTWIEIVPAAEAKDTIKAGDTVATSNLPSLFNNAPITISATR